MPDKKKKSLPSSAVHEVQPRGLTLRACGSDLRDLFEIRLYTSKPPHGLRSTDENHSGPLIELKTAILGQ